MNFFCRSLYTSRMGFPLLLCSMSWYAVRNSVLRLTPSLHAHSGCGKSIANAWLRMKKEKPA